ncbi:MAG: hypothetical protein KA717_07860 [Woronichinia naegeliana WA131]|jgi:hypothetical protein|uniref:Uncharacterized protein n=1 Tax=Woronichinia naegeliana WA131 TaxID=2824559 RepID=A0A977L1G6_9CYAN|nr:MAG: hypothetical protein KA717_07860 [Woronichinia naegeliana WA131]
MTLSINPNQADIFEKVRDIVANKLSLDGSKITPQSNFANDLAIILFVKALIGSLSNKISQNKQLILIQLVRE